MNTAVIDGVLDALALAQPEATLYTEEVQQGFNAPAFFVRIYPVRQERLLDRRYRREYNVLVQYYPLPPTDGSSLRKNRDFQLLADQLFDELRRVSVGTGTVAVTGMNYEINDGVLSFFVTYAFYLREQKEEQPRMMELHQEVELYE